MTYIIQFVAMAIALVSQFFDSVEKDGSGKRLTTRHGFPILRRAGYWFVALIFLSFLGSVFSARLDKKRENELSGSLTTVRRQNAQLIRSLNDLSQSSAGKFKENLEGLQRIRHQEEEAGVTTAKNIKESSSILLQRVETQLVPSKWVSLAIVLDAPRLGPEQFRRLTLLADRATAKDIDSADVVLQDLVCGERNRVESFELRILLSSIPYIEYVMSRRVNNDKCWWNTSLKIVDADGKERLKEVMSSVVALKRVGDPTTRLKMADVDSQTVAVFSQIVTAGDLLGRPLYASSFGEQPTATLAVSAGRDLTEPPNPFEKLEGRIPKSLSINVQGFYFLPKNSTYPLKPSFERTWYLKRGDSFDRIDREGGRIAEYVYQSP